CNDAVVDVLFHKLARGETQQARIALGKLVPDQVQVFAPEKVRDGTVSGHHQNLVNIVDHFRRDDLEIVAVSQMFDDLPGYIGKCPIVRVHDQGDLGLAQNVTRCDSRLKNLIVALQMGSG